jgi:hypothetical protein
MTQHSTASFNAGLHSSATPPKENKPLSGTGYDIVQVFTSRVLEQGAKVNQSYHPIIIAVELAWQSNKPRQVGRCLCWKSLLFGAHERLGGGAPRTVDPWEADAWRSSVFDLHSSLTKWKFEPQRDIVPLNCLKQKG